MARSLIGLRRLDSLACPGNKSRQNGRGGSLYMYMPAWPEFLRSQPPSCSFRMDADEGTDAAELLLGPARSIVAKAAQAAHNAAGHEAMLAAAKSLGREGERAVHRLEPLCLKLQQLHQDEFTKAIKANGALCHHVIFTC